MTGCVMLDNVVTVARKNGKRLPCERLQADNAKLREALCAAWKCAHAGISCSDCRLIAGGCTLQTAMQELGIEVDE